MQKIAQQFALVRSLWFGSETRQLYLATLQRLGSTIVETLRLGWLLFCLFFLVFIWSGAATRRGLYTLMRLPEIWAEQQAKKAAQAAQREREREADRLAKANQPPFNLGAALKNALAAAPSLAIAQAKAQLGIQADPVALKAIAPSTPQDTSQV